MYQNLQPVSPVTDANVTFSVSNSWQFAAGTTSISITFDEANDLAREFVLMFSGDGAATPVCLLGAQGAGNQYINAEGGWAAKAVPARLRAYPFACVAGAREGQAVLLRDAAAPHFKQGQGEPLFDAGGQASALLRQAEVFLTQVHDGLAKARRIGEQLRDAGVLCPVKLEAPAAANKPVLAEGFLSIDVAKFDQLAPAVRAALDASGATALVVAQRRSITNASRLLPPATSSAAATEKPQRRTKAAEASTGAKPARATAKVAAATGADAGGVKKPRAPRKPTA